LYHYITVYLTKMKTCLSFLLTIVLAISIEAFSTACQSKTCVPSSYRTSFSSRRTTLFIHHSKTNNNSNTDSPTNASQNMFNNDQMRRSFLISTALAGLTNLGLAVAAPPGFQRISTQFIAALGDPESSSGNNASEWGLWRLDPGPRGVFLRDYERDIVKRNGKAPSGWNFDINDWWVEEHGLIMESPTFPVDPGRYLVTGGRLVTTVLDIKKDGSWSLENGKLYDVTHLPCRSARYAPNHGNGSPLTANQKDFPVAPGAEMPKIEGCNKQDYAVLFVIGKEMS
jgi:hypothetical protein